MFSSSDPQPLGAASDGANPDTRRDDLEVSFPIPGAAVVALNGEHDLTNAVELRSVLEALVADHPMVLVDVTEAQFIDSTVINTLVNADGRARAVDHRFILVAGTAPIVATVLRISGLLDYLECAESVEEVLARS